MTKRSFSDDDFKDIESLIPKKPVKQSISPSLDTSAVYLEFGEDKPNDAMKLGLADNNRPVSFEKSYEPTFSLIKQVNIRARLSPTRFYADFVNDAKKYLNAHGSKCDAVPFPAYIPEYRSMKKSQLDYYFYFRDAVKSNQAPNSPFSYILLLLFEIINLPNEIDTNRGASIIYFLWKNYRNIYSRLDTYIPEWLCDYALIHQVELDFIPLDDIQRLAELSSFPEFYINTAKCDRYLLLCKTCTYTPNSDGRYPETESFLKEHVLAAVDAVSIQKYNKKFVPETYLALTTGARTAYRSALCSSDNNALISFTYRSFAKKTSAIQNLSECVKYAENKVRAYFQIRSRLKCPTLDSFEKSVIDDYFNENLPIVRKKRTAAYEGAFTGENDYMYEPESVGISFDAAKNIEKQSWRATAMLEEAFEEESPVYRVKEEKSDVVEETNNSILRSDEFEFLHLIYDDKTAEAIAFAKSIGNMPEALAEKINVYAFDKIGDSVIEDTGTGFVLIEDYKEDVSEWLTK